eukprot:g43805.t1
MSGKEIVPEAGSSRGEKNHNSRCAIISNLQVVRNVEVLVLDWGGQVKSLNVLLKRQIRDTTGRVPSTSWERRNYTLFFAAFDIKLPSLQDSIDHNTIQPCYGNLCNSCQIINIDKTI